MSFIVTAENRAFSASEPAETHRQRSRVLGDRSCSLAMAAEELHANGYVELERLVPDELMALFESSSSSLAVVDAMSSTATGLREYSRARGAK